MVSLALFYYSEAEKKVDDYRKRYKEAQKRGNLEKKEAEEKFFPFPVPDSIRWKLNDHTDRDTESIENWERGIKEVIDAFDYANVDIEIKNYFNETLYEGMKSYNIFTGNMKEVVVRGLDEYPEKRKERIREEIILEKDAEKKLKDRKLAIERLPKRIDNIEKKELGDKEARGKIEQNKRQPTILKKIFEVFTTISVNKTNS